MLPGCISRTSLLTPAKSTCATRQAFFAGLREFQRDLRQHLYLEETILFPRALALEGQLLARRQA